MGDQFDQFEAEDVLILQQVRMFGPHDAQEIVVVELAFNEFPVFIYVVSEDDTLVCTRSVPQSHLAQYSRPVSATFWNTLVGNALTDAWQMVNDRGYKDAIQLRFRDLPSEGSYTTIQITAIASRIYLAELEVVREHR